MKARITVLSIAVVFAALLLLAFLGKSTAKENKIYPVQGWTLVYAHTSILNQQRVLNSMAVRYLSEDGRWKETKFHFLSNGKFKFEREASDKRGVFLVDEDKISPVGNSPASVEMSLSQYSSEGFLRSSPQFQRESEVAGLKTFVWSHSPGENGDYWTDEYSAQVGGAIPLRSVHYGANGSVVDEMVAVLAIPGQPSEAAYAIPDNLKIDTKFLDEAIDRSKDTALRSLKDKLVNK